MEIDKLILDKHVYNSFEILAKFINVYDENY